MGITIVDNHPKDKYPGSTIVPATMTVVGCKLHMKFDAAYDEVAWSWPEVVALVPILQAFLAGEEL